MENLGSSETITAPPHPLLIAEILPRVFSSLADVENLKRIRLVCKLWNEMSLDPWRNLATLELLWRTDSRPCSHHCTLSTNEADSDRRASLDIATFLELVQNSTEQQDSCSWQLAKKPFARYRIQQCSLLDTDNGEVDNLQILFKLCGPHIKYLELDHCTIYSNGYEKFFSQILSDELRNLEELLVLFVPVEPLLEKAVENENVAGLITSAPPSAVCLERLSLGQCKNAGEAGVGMPTGKDWRDFFHHTPNLKNLTVDVGAVTSILELKQRSSTGLPIRLATVDLLCDRNNLTLGPFLRFSWLYESQTNAQFELKFFSLPPPTV